jgi:hypothetical protein
MKGCLEELEYVLFLFVGPTGTAYQRMFSQ